MGLPEMLPISGKDCSKETRTGTWNPNTAHSLDVDAVVEALHAPQTGLTSAQVYQRREELGSNSLPHGESKPAWRRFLGHFEDVLIYILLTAAVLKALTGDQVNFAVIAAAALAVATVGFIQEGRAEQALESIRSMLSLEAQARRDGEWAVVDAESLVPGDLVRVRSRDRVPADLRAVETIGLQCDESALTGESVPVTKSVDPVGLDAGIGDRSSMLFSGTIITSGTATGIVTATGARTQLGHITAMVSEVEQLQTPLAAQLGRLAKRISVVIGVLAALILLVGRLVHDFPFDELLSAAIGFAVAAVPEGLPALVTITLALGVQQMARRNAITRRMPAVETLGAVTTICSDKTGTLTQNEMTAATVVSGDEAFSVSGTGYGPDGRISRDGERVDTADHPALEALTTAVGLCNDARIETADAGWRVVGQPTEGALAVLATKAGGPRPASRILQIPFESAHKFAVTVDVLEGRASLVHVVGAPDRLLDRASTEMRADGTTAPLDRRAWESRLEELSSTGLRVLAAARRSARDHELGSLELADVDDLTFLGVVGIIDPPRPEATEAIAKAHEAGIRVKMITGDHVGTAVAIARQLGIAGRTRPHPQFMGADRDRLGDHRRRHPRRVPRRLAAQR